MNASFASQENNFSGKYSKKLRNQTREHLGNLCESNNYEIQV